MHWAKSTDLLGSQDAPLAESSRARYQTLTDLSKFYTSRKKNVQRIGQLQYMENRCSYCGSGMAPPSIQRCTRCNKQWMHTYCSPMLVSVSGLPNFCCSGCSLGGRLIRFMEPQSALYARLPFATTPVDSSARLAISFTMFSASWLNVRKGARSSRLSSSVLGVLCQQSGLVASAGRAVWSR